MNEHAINSTPAPSANGANGHVSTTSKEQVFRLSRAGNRWLPLSFRVVSNQAKGVSTRFPHGFPLRLQVSKFPRIGTSTWKPSIIRAALAEAIFRGGRRQELVLAPADAALFECLACPFVADSLPAKVSPPTPSCSNGIDVLPSKTCARCLGRGRVIVNAGTGLLLDCRACIP